MPHGIIIMIIAVYQTFSGDSNHNNHYNFSYSVQFSMSKPTIYFGMAVHVDWRDDIWLPLLGFGSTPIGL